MISHLLGNRVVKMIYLRVLSKQLQQRFPFCKQMVILRARRYISSSTIHSRHHLDQLVENQLLENKSPIFNFYSDLFYETYINYY